MDAFLQTLAGGLVLAALGGIAFLAWELPSLYLRGFLFAAGALLCLAVALTLLNAGYGWGWEDALADVATRNPNATLPIRGGVTQAWMIAGIFCLCGYVLFLGWIAVLSRRNHRRP